MSTVTPTKKAKPRSPAVPSRTLEDSLADVRRLYDEFSHGSFTVAEIGSTLRVSASAGPFKQRLYTLKTYGLLEPDGNNLKVSKLFTDLNSASRGDTLFKTRALQAIRNSRVFAALLDSFPSKLPAETVVAQRLETQMKFNADRAKVAAKVLVSSLSFAGVLDAAGNILPAREGPGTSGPAAMREAEEPDTSQKRAGALTSEIPLAGGRIASVAYPEDLTPEEANKISQVLRAVAGEAEP